MSPIYCPASNITIVSGALRLRGQHPADTSAQCVLALDTDHFGPGCDALADQFPTARERAFGENFWQGVMAKFDKAIKKFATASFNGWYVAQSCLRIVEPNALNLPELTIEGRARA